MESLNDTGLDDFPHQQLDRFLCVLMSSGSRAASASNTSSSSSSSCGQCQRRAAERPAAERPAASRQRQQASASGEPAAVAVAGATQRLTGPKTCFSSSVRGRLRGVGAATRRQGTKGGFSEVGTTNKARGPKNALFRPASARAEPPPKGVGTATEARGPTNALFRPPREPPPKGCRRNRARAQKRAFPASARAEPPPKESAQPTRRGPKNALFRPPRGPRPRGARAKKRAFRPARAPGPKTRFSGLRGSAPEPPPKAGRRVNKSRAH